MVVAPRHQAADDARRRHYAHFYGLEPLPGGGRPLVLVHGNCQAEALRVVLDASTDEVATVRMPPVHELEEHDLPHLRRLLDDAAVLVTQPVRDDWRDLPVGSAQLAARSARASTVTVPVVRHVGLHPWGALVRTPWRGDPPVVPYHDLRTILAVARGTTRGPEGRVAAAGRPAGHLRPEGFRAVARRSLDELRRRERAHAALAASDLVEAAGAGAMLTINHPGNEVLVPLAGRVLAAIGVATPARDPGRTLLSSVRAPLRPEVLEALGLDPSAARGTWSTGGREIADEDVAADQAGWYAERPEIVAAALRRYAPAIEALGL